jgi:hypothetical protein
MMRVSVYVRTSTVSSVLGVLPRCIPTARPRARLRSPLRALVGPRTASPLGICVYHGEAEQHDAVVSSEGVGVYSRQSTPNHSTTHCGCPTVGWFAVGCLLACTTLGRAKRLCVSPQPHCWRCERGEAPGMQRASAGRANVRLEACSSSHLVYA